MIKAMRAVVFDKGLKYCPAYPTPAPARGEALVRVTACGICNTDLEIIRGYSGFTGILGHEFCGIVESAGSMKGKRVVGEINLGCRDCEMCRAGLSNHCGNRTVLGIVSKNGAMADYLTLPLENLHEIPENVTDKEAVFVEPLAAAMQILEQVKPEPGLRVLVMGDGKLGILCALALSLACNNVRLSGKHSAKLDIARSLGINAVHRDGIDQVFDLVVEATGAQNGLQEAIGRVRPRGRVVLKSTVAEQSSLHLFPIVVNEISILGSRCGPFPRAIAALQEKRINVLPLLTASYPIEQALEAFARAAAGDAIKILLTLDNYSDY